MNRRFAFWFGLCLVTLLIGAAITIRMEDGRLFMTWEATGVMLLKGGYRSYRLEYSYGRTIDDKGRWKTLWHAPRFAASDMRYLPRFIDHGVWYTNATFVRTNSAR